MKYLVTVAVIICILGYILSISKTVSEYRLYRHLKNNANNDIEIKPEVFQLKKRNDHLNKLIQSFSLDTLSIDKNLLAVSSSYCQENQLSLAEYKPYINLASDSSNIIRRSISVKGSFVNCLELLNKLEIENMVGKIASVKFQTDKKNKYEANALTCTIVVENLINSYEKN
jgi:hypothetical protein